MNNLDLRNEMGSCISFEQLSKLTQLFVDKEISDDGTGHKYTVTMYFDGYPTWYSDDYADPAQAETVRARVVAKIQAKQPLCP